MKSIAVATVAQGQGGYRLAIIIVIVKPKHERSNCWEFNPGILANL